MAPSNEDKRPIRRLIITKIEMENFKSYAGVQTIGPFHKFFSAVVGPNGSGKSNVIDALLFAFGHKASRIRLKKISELVHKSSNHPNLKMARVTIHWSDIYDYEGEQCEEIPGTQFTLTRTADVNDTSKYYLNDKKSTYGEVRDMLREKGIDLDHNRFLILQGEVEAISMMPPKARNEHETGMLEYLEDIIGTARYKPLIEDSGRILDDITEKRETALGMVKTSQRARDDLKTAKKEAMDYLKLEATYFRAQSLSHQISAASVSNRIIGCQKSLDGLKTQNAELTKEMKGMEGELEKQAALDKKFKEELAKKEKAKKIASDKVSKLKQEQALMAENRKNVEKKRKKLQDTIKRDEMNLQQHKNEARRAQEEVDTDERALAELRPILNRLEEDLEKEEAAHQGALEPLRKELEKGKKAIAPFKGKLNHAESDLKVALDQRELLLGEAQSLTVRLEKEQAACEELRKSLAELESEHMEGYKRGEELVKVAKQKEAHMGTLNTNRDQMKADLQEVRNQLARLREEASKANESQSNNHLVRWVMDKKKKGELKGVHGRLGDLGAIDQKYDVAISTACPQLNNLVVDDLRSGQAVLQALRTANVGRTTVYIIEDKKDLYQKAHSQIQVPPGAQRLYDLIQVKDDRYKVVFYGALHDTLVCNTFDDATRIAFQSGKRWRVVTLDGKIIDPSGLMSGGGRPRGGLMGGSIQQDMSPEELARNQKATAQLAGQEKELETQKMALDQEEEELRRELRSIQEDLDKTMSTARGLKTSIECKKQALKDGEQRLKQLQQDAKKEKESGSENSALKAADQQIQDLEKKRDEVLASMQQMQDEIKEIEKRMDDIGGLEYKKLKYQKESKTREIKEKESQVTKNRVTIKTQEQAATKLEARIKKEKAQSEKEDSNDESSTGKMQELEKHILKFTQALDRLDAELQQFLSDRGETADVSELKKALADKKVQKAEKDNQVKENEKELKQMQDEVERFERRITKFDEDLKKRVDQYGTEFLDSLTTEVGESQTQMDPMDEDEEEQPRRGRKKRKAAALPSQVQLPAMKKRKGNAGLTTRVEDISCYDRDSVKTQVIMLEESYRNMKVVNLGALLEYQEREKEYQTKAQQLKDISAQRDEKLREYEELKGARRKEFESAFKIINDRLKEMFQMVTMGGDAELEYKDKTDPFAEGVTFEVRPNRKSWKSVQNLSGGEKTLSSLALVFALHHYQPSPLYVLDEIDAALDFMNVSIVGSYIKERAQNAQFIIISLRNNMFELANRLVGIYKTHECTKSVTIDPQKFHGVVMESAATC